jgi:hypothetical protein
MAEVVVQIAPNGRVAPYKPFRARVNVYETYSGWAVVVRLLTGDQLVWQSDERYGTVRRARRVARRVERALAGIGIPVART